MRSDRIVRVVPDVPAIHRRFDYVVPPALDADIGVGARVRIDLHGRRVGGWVVEDGVDPPRGVLPKPLAGSSGDGPPPSVVSLAEWAAWRWAGPLSSFLGTASPSHVVRNVRAGRPDQTGIGAPPVPSPGGGSVALVDAALSGPAAVVRLAPALDAGLVVEEFLHRIGPSRCAGSGPLSPPGRSTGRPPGRIGRDRRPPARPVGSGRHRKTRW